MCNGASSTSSWRTSFTSGVINVEWANFSPPCTTLCPTALISSRLFTAPYSGFTKMSNTLCKATSWFGRSSSNGYLSPFLVLWVIFPPSIPTLSTSPEHKTSLFSISNIWYLREELPALRIRIFIFFIIIKTKIQA